jgi:hypothetical protein
MFAVVVALAAADTRFFLPGAVQSPAQVAAPVQYASPAQYSSPAVVPVILSGAQSQGDASASSGRQMLFAAAGFALGFGASLAVLGKAAPQAQRRAATPRMDETIIQKALAGELEEEGAENVFMSEVGWASYLDKEAGSSYAMNQRVSKADDGYFTPDVFSNPVDVAKSWFESMKGVVNDPLEAGFMTISNDESGARSWGKGATEVDARTIKPKVKNFDKSMRVTGIEGVNVFGAPGAKAKLPGGFGKETPKPFFYGLTNFLKEKGIIS